MNGARYVKKTVPFHQSCTQLATCPILLTLECLLLSFLLISKMASSGDANKPQAWNPPAAPTPPPTYNQVSVTPLLPSSTSKLVTLAGQTGLVKETGKVTSSDIKEQSRQAYRNVASCLAAAGATPRDIIFVRHYIVKDTGRAEDATVDVVDRGWGEQWIEFMDREAGGHRPPDTVVGVASLAKAPLLYEVEAWAIVHG